MITFICALPQEAKHLRKLSIVQNGKATLVCAGVGPRHAEHATREHLRRQKPSLVISAGVAGALAADLKIGDVIVARDVIDESTRNRFPCHSLSPQSSVLSTTAGILSTILSVSRMIGSAEEKKELGRTFHAVAVDMESAAIARVCAEHDVPFAAIRAISDTADEALPEAMKRFFDADGDLQVVHVIAELAKHPSLWKTLSRLQKQTATAGDALKKFLESQSW